MFAHSNLLIADISLIQERKQMACNPDHSSFHLMCQKHILLQLNLWSKIYCHSQWYLEVNRILSRIKILKGEF